MVKKYFKTSDPKVVIAHNRMVKDSEALAAACKKFAAQFGAANMMATTMTGRSFGGVHFDNFHLKEDKHLWTKPDSNGISRPRSAINVNAFKAQFKYKDVSDEEVKAKLKQAKADLAALNTKYYEGRVGMEPVSFDDFFKSFGTDWGNLMFSGLRWLPHDGFMYFETGADFSDRMTEILGSEFEAAEAACKG